MSKTDIEIATHDQSQKQPAVLSRSCYDSFFFFFFSEVMLLSQASAYKGLIGGNTLISTDSRLCSKPL